MVPQIPRRGAGEYAGTGAAERAIRRARATADDLLRKQIAGGAALDQAGRRRLADALTGYVLSLDDNPLQGQPERLPLKLVGDGTTPRYQDNEAGQVTLHSRESLVSAGAALGDPKLDELRFRHNIVIDGVAAWEEQSWVGGRLRVGDVAFETVVPKVRCLATHANPVTGERDCRSCRCW